ncbi:protein Daple [Drosophila ficusphila]|uniref:protein Daple n=1 Tax=Drosophila ficusphila TaxID=30025 RepID=UPI0007E82299|nr:protein Daple [Drosophila ficusphila]XP_017055834.1 protein Daple [Drosophila ficusphila]
MEKRSTSTMQVLYAELAAAKARSAQLEEENILLRHRLNRASANHSTNAAINVEAKILAFQLEEERDRLVETLQKHKKKYNKLHDAYLEKVKRCRALEEMFKRQKTLTGLVMKSALDQRNAEQKMMIEKRQSAQGDLNELQELKAKVEKLQRALDESYDIIDEMDFELESVDLLEMQNQSLRDELAALKIKTEEGATSLAASVPDDDDPPPKYEEDFPGAHSKARLARRSSSSSEEGPKDDDADAETMERAALTHSLIQTVETESNALRRELLRSRCQRTIRAKLEKESEAAD